MPTDEEYARQPDEASRQREYKHFVSDLRTALRAGGEE
jgi:hypothetical protein